MKMDVVIRLSEPVSGVEKQGWTGCRGWSEGRENGRAKVWVIGLWRTCREAWGRGWQLGYVRVLMGCWRSGIGWWKGADQGVVGYGVGDKTSLVLQSKTWVEWGYEARLRVDRKCVSAGPRSCIWARENGWVGL